MSSLLDNKWLSVAVWALMLLMSSLMFLVQVFTIRSWGIGTFPSIDRNIIQLTEQGAFRDVLLVDADGSLSILRYARSPAGRLFHVFPAAAWSIIALFQVSPSFRSKYPMAHRLMGRIFIGMSVCIAIGVPCLMYSGVTKVHYGVLDGGVTLASAAYFLLTALLAIHHARNKRFVRHRIWALRHLAMGYHVHLTRVLSLTWSSVGEFFPGSRDHTEEGAEIRSKAFLAYTWGSMVLTVSAMEVWLHHTRTAPWFKTAAAAAEGKAL